MTKILNEGRFGLGAQFEGKFRVLAPYSFFLLLTKNTPKTVKKGQNCLELLHDINIQGQIFYHHA